MSSRLAQVANQRRKERRQKKADEIAVNKSGVSCAGSLGKQTIGSAPTTSSVTFDDSTITSRASSAFENVSSFTDESGSFDFAPPMIEITTPRNNRRDGNGSSAGAPTPKHRNVGFSKNSACGKLKSAGSSVTSATTATVTVSSSDCSNVSPVTKIATAKNGTARGTRFAKKGRGRSSSGGGRNSLDSCGSAGGVDDDASVVSASTISSTLTAMALKEQIKHLTTERDRLKSDLSTFKRKFQNATEQRVATGKEKDAEISEIKGRLEEVAKDLILERNRTRDATLSAGVAANKVHSVEERYKESAKMRDVVHAKEVEELKSRLNAKEEELKGKLGEVAIERDELEEKLRKSMEKLSMVEKECKVRYGSIFSFCCKLWYQCI